MIQSLKNLQFRQVYSRGKSKADYCIAFYFLENDLSVNRLGITVSKKIGNSVVRSRVKRIIKEKKCVPADNVLQKTTEPADRA